ncbi:MAG: arylesterase [Rhodobacteraceae bacterium]|nr:arylesterase [Paracoccaceae bacterium]
MRKVLLALVMQFILAMTPAVAAPLRIAALGDSLVHGFGLIESDGFVPQLQVWLKEHGSDAVVANFGVSGDTTAGGAARADWSLTDDIGAMIVVLGGNDVLRGLDPAQSRANLRQILLAAQGKEVEVLLVGMEAPGNYGPDYKADFDSIYADLAEEFDTLLYPYFFTALSDRVGDLEQVREVMQDDGIHPNRKGVRLIVEDIGPSVLDLVERASK